MKMSKIDPDEALDELDYDKMTIQFKEFMDNYPLVSFFFKITMIITAIIVICIIGRYV